LGGDTRETNVTVYKAVGCQACSQKGYNGRISLAEIIRIDSDLRKQIDDLVPTSQLKRYLYEQGAVLMRKDGLLKAEAGLTSIEEVGRVIQLEAH
jgi:type II secretory ATPase GspE/PulE/Tfp pilus assembly ATPase PilB-like protein